MTARLIQAVDSGLTVLVPNTELAAALADAVERSHRRRDARFGLPRASATSGAGSRIGTSVASCSTRRLPRCLSDAEERELWRDAVLGSDPGQRFLEPSGAARAARSARRAIQEYGIPMGAIAADGGEEASMFVEWSARFAQRCRDLKCVGADELLGSAVGVDGAGAAFDADGGANVAWIESPLWRPVARRWLERHAGAPLAPARARPAPARYARRNSPRAKSPAAELAAIGRMGARPACDARRIFAPGSAFPISRTAPGARGCVRRGPGAASVRAARGGSGRAVCRRPAARRSPTTRRCARRSSCLRPPADAMPFARFSALLRAPELQASAARGERRRPSRCRPALLRSRRGAAARVADARPERVGSPQQLRPVTALARLRRALRAARRADRQPPHEPLALGLDRGLRERAVEFQASLVERRVSGRRAISRAARDAGAGRCELRQPEPGSARAHSAARGARHALPGADRSSAHLGERAVDGSLARL